MKIRYDTYCGLNCAACPVGIANELEDRDMIRKMSKEWGRNPEELSCHGCKSEETAVFCRDCSMRLCALEKGLEFCFQCEAYPCQALLDFRDDDASLHSMVLFNQERIKDMGFEAWLESEEKRWSCPGCGRRFSWYSGTCPECGEKLYSCVMEEKDLTE